MSMKGYERSGLDWLDVESVGMSNRHGLNLVADLEYFTGPIVWAFGSWVLHIISICIIKGFLSFF